MAQLTSSRPPVLCRTRSSAHRGSASHRPSDGVTVTRLRCLAKTAQRGTLTQDIAKFGHRRLGWRRMGKPAAAGMNHRQLLVLLLTLYRCSRRCRRCPHICCRRRHRPPCPLLACPCFCNPGRQCKMATPPQQLCNLQSHSLLRQRRRRHRETPRPSAPAWKALRALHHLKLVSHPWIHLHPMGVRSH